MNKVLKNVPNPEIEKIKKMIVHSDKNIIETAREAFGQKKYAQALELYATVENKSLLNDLDKQIIAHCKNYPEFDSK